MEQRVALRIAKALERIADALESPEDLQMLPDGRGGYDIVTRGLVP